MKKISSFILTFSIITLLFFSASVQPVLINQNKHDIENINTRQLNQIEIPPGSDYYVKFNAKNNTLEKMRTPATTNGLSDEEIRAIAKSPSWIQDKLIYQFKNLENTNDYVNLLLRSELTYTDEIAFTIASSPIGKVPPVEVIEENANMLYQIDAEIQYADIKDIDEGNGNYYSTIQYRVKEENITKEIKCPPHIYYWYLVHPRINREDPILVYNRTWREYLFYHNDVGHPLLKENIDGIKHLWDQQSHTTQTGIYAVKHWIQNNIRYEIIGDRPGHPNEIAHEHTGYCGETQKLAVAAYRTALIPMNGIMNYAEDHVWSEFYERGWYHYDGAINKPYMYTDGWGKDMSSVWAWNPDSSIYEVTPSYLHPEDRVSVTFNVKDAYNNPVDGAIITVLVEGLKDITYYKSLISDILATVWQKIPELLKINLFEKIYTDIQQKISDIDEVIETYQVSIWNYTDTDGTCTLELGKDDSYIILIQKPDLRSVWPVYRFTRTKFLLDPVDSTFDIRLPDFSNRFQKLTERNTLEGDYKGIVKINLSSFQYQRNILTREIGMYDTKSVIDFFIVDEKNFNKYQHGKPFDHYHYEKTGDNQIEFQLDENDYYLVFRNPYQMTTINLNYDLTIESSVFERKVEIITPTTERFNHPIYPIGTQIKLSGITSEKILSLSINDVFTDEIFVNQPRWEYIWDSTNRTPGMYQIRVDQHGYEDSISVQLIDTIPPKVFIDSPEHQSIFEDEIITIKGRSSDNYKIKQVDLSINDQDSIDLDGKKEWSYQLDTSVLPAGEHKITITASDATGLRTSKNLTIIKNDTLQSYKPQINSIFYTPAHPTNTSRIRFYANVSSTSPYSIKQVILYLDKGSEPSKLELYRYGDYPSQKRHIEDNIQDLPNDPIYGIDIGSCSSQTTITYFIEAIDSAHNSMRSETQTLIIP